MADAALCDVCHRTPAYPSTVPGLKHLWMCKPCNDLSRIKRDKYVLAEKLKAARTKKRLQVDAKPRRNARGSNQYRARRRNNLDWSVLLFLACMLAFGLYFLISWLSGPRKMVSPLPQAHADFLSPLPTNSARAGLRVTATPTPSSPRTAQGEVDEPSELEQIVAYIARKFEPEGKDVVVRAINCFYSESGLRAHAVGQNTDEPLSRDHGVAQLNDYWHRLTPAQKTDIYANIDKAYEIYKGRGDNFSAWYGRLCND